MKSAPDLMPVASSLKDGVLSLLVSITLVACATLVPPPGDPAQDTALKTFTVAVDKAGLFVYRNEALQGSPPLAIEVDGQVVGRTAHMSYIYVELPPGRHHIRAVGDDVATTLTFEARPGTLSYVWEEEAKFDKRHGWSRLHLVNEVEGRNGVLRAKLAGEPFVMKPIVATPLVQTIQVRVEIDSAPAIAPIDCEATNDLGRWPFKAPGALTVHVSREPLQVICQPPEGYTGEQAPLLPRDPTTRHDNAREGMKTGALVGTGIGVGLAVASFPLFGPLGLLFVPGAALRGAEVGTLVGTVQPEQPLAYPDPIVVRLSRVAGKPDDVQR